MKLFTVNGIKYRIKTGLFVDELEVKEGARYVHLAYIRDLQDALNVINKAPRNLK